jgi:hypothetical protein
MSFDVPLSATAAQPACSSRFVIYLAALEAPDDFQPR